MLRLVIKTADTTRLVETALDRFTIGRTADADVVLEGEKNASRRHCLLERRGRMFVLFDLSSKNGTHVDGRPVQRTLLGSGDEFRVGDSRIAIEVDEPDERQTEGGWLKPGGFVDGWLVKRRLGAGPRGETYEGVRFNPTRRAVLKLFEGQAPPAVDRDLDGIVAVDATADWEGGQFWIRDKVEGTSLAERWRRGPLSSAEAGRVLAGALAALDGLHGAGWAHGRIGPGNVLLDGEGGVHLTDGGAPGGDPAADVVALADLVEEVVDCADGALAGLLSGLREVGTAAGGRELVRSFLAGAGQRKRAAGGRDLLAQAAEYDRLGCHEMSLKALERARDLGAEDASLDDRIAGARRSIERGRAVQLVEQGDKYAAAGLTTQATEAWSRARDLLSEGDDLLIDVDRRLVHSAGRRRRRRRLGQGLAAAAGACAFALLAVFLLVREEAAADATPIDPAAARAAAEAGEQLEGTRRQARAALAEARRHREAGRYQEALAIYAEVLASGALDEDEAAAARSETAGPEAFLEVCRARFAEAREAFEKGEPLRAAAFYEAVLAETEHAGTVEYRTARTAAAKCRYAHHVARGTAAAADGRPVDALEAFARANDLAEPANEKRIDLAELESQASRWSDGQDRLAVARAQWHLARGDLAAAAGLLAGTDESALESLARSGRLPAGMAFVPGGVHVVGSADRPDEGPPHPVELEPFLIDRTEVSAGDYARFVAATGHRPPAGWGGSPTPPPAEADRPVTGVTWHDATAYAAWAGKRLPTEEEWEAAARLSLPADEPTLASLTTAPDGLPRPYPWGEVWVDGLVARDQTVPVDSLRAGRSPLGIHHMAGNAWEWTSSIYDSYHDDIRHPAANGRYRVVKGGSFRSRQESLRLSRRGSYLPGTRFDDLGFRCAISVEEAIGR